MNDRRPFHHLKPWPYAVPITLGLCAIVLSCTLTYPFNNDNALYAYMADLALKGHMPYLGSWDQNFPAIVAVHALQILVSGRSQCAFHAFDIILQLIGSYFLVRVGARLYDLRAGLLAALLASLYYVQQGLWMAGERDPYVSILLIIAFYFALDRRHAVSVGALSAIMFLFRPTYALYSLVFLAWYFRKRDKAAIEFTLGAILPLVVFVLWYAAIGGLKDFWDATILFNLKIYSGQGASFNIWEPVRFYALSVIAVLAASTYLWRRERPAFWLWAGLFATSVISLVVLYRHSVYHYHPAMTLLLLLTAIGWIRLADFIPRRMVRVSFSIAVVLYYVFSTFRGNTIEHVLADIVNGRIHSFAQSYDRYEPSPMFGVGVQTEVGDYLSEHTHPGDTVQMFGPYSYPQYRAELVSASRFQTLHAVAMRGAADTLMPFQKEWRKEYMNDLRSKKPLYFIVCDAPEAFRQYYGGR